jgi:predicted GIY-YIG superfamily endonuclease
MPSKVIKPKVEPSKNGWFVYIVKCADDSLYTGIAKDVGRRFREHNAGTASKYTRSRRPVKLIHLESHPNQSSALKRELAIKALDRQEKLTMIKRDRSLAKRMREVARLEDVPNVGPSIANDFRQLGIATPAELSGRDPYLMYDELCRVTGVRHDPCVLDTFIAAVRYMEGAPKRPWWKYTAERKRELALRSSQRSTSET